jgi:ectoine hydroxylase-related dioxygenase (phytanoyl-CoA dioxygenase family)
MLALAAVTAKTGEGVTVDASDHELQQYLFDLQGYLVIHDVLRAAEVAELNRLIDAQRLPSPRERIRFGSAAGLHGPDHGFLNWGEPFCRLLDHEAILPILRLRLGDCFRLDRLYGIRMHKGQTMGSMHADYGASARNSFTKPGERFHFAPNGIYEGFTVVAWNLADAGPASGGFWCIPGSHKSHFKLPRQIHEAPEKASCVVIPDVPAGSVVLFSEAVMHGTAPWRADHERRTLLYKYCVSQMAWSRARVLPPPDVPLTPRQQALLTEPADPHTFVPSLFSDGPEAER